jgi:hypothetical protein
MAFRLAAWAPRATTQAPKVKASASIAMSATAFAVRIPALMARVPVTTLGAASFRSAMIARAAHKAGGADHKVHAPADAP